MKRVLSGLLCLAMMLALVGCYRERPDYTPTGDGLAGDEPSRPTESPVTEQDMTLAYFPDRSMNPLKSSDYTNRMIFGLVYQGLFAVDDQYNAVPVLCEKFTVSRDMKRYTFYPAGASFSDGAKLTAKDVAASLKAAMKDGYYVGRFSQVQSVFETEDGGVLVELKTPYEHFELLLDVPIVKSSQVKEDYPLGTGAYLYETYEGKPRLRRRSGWWCSAKLAITAQVISLVEGENPGQLRDEFQSGSLSLVCADPGAVTYAEFNSDYELWDCENGVFLYLGCNLNSPVLSNQSIRGALTYAIDRVSIVEQNYRGFAYATALPVSPQSPWYAKSLANRVSLNPERLTQAVELAQLESNTLTLLVNTDDGVRLRVARQIAQSLNQCGLKVTTAEKDTASYLEALSAGEFDLYLGQTKLSPNMDLTAFFAPDGALNFGSISSASMHMLCLEALANSGNYYTLQQKLLENGAIVPILFRSFAIFAQRGAFEELYPARDYVFFYSIGTELGKIRQEVA